MRDAVLPRAVRTGGVSLDRMKVAAGDSHPAPRVPPTRKWIAGIEPALGGLRWGEPDLRPTEYYPPRRTLAG